MIKIEMNNNYKFLGFHGSFSNNDPFERSCTV